MRMLSYVLLGKVMLKWLYVRLGWIRLCYDRKTLVRLGQIIIWKAQGVPQ